MVSDDPFEGTPFVSAISVASEWSDEFHLPKNAADLIDIVLDPDIRAARAEIHNRIDQGALVGQGGIVENVATPFDSTTPAVKTFSKAVTDIHLLTKQAERNRRRR